MHAKIMQLVGKLLASNSQYAGIKVSGEAPAVWLTAAQMPTRDSHCRESRQRVPAV